MDTQQEVTKPKVKHPHYSARHAHVRDPNVKLKARLAEAREVRGRLAREVAALALESSLGPPQTRARAKKRLAAADAKLTTARGEALRLEAELRRKERWVVDLAGESAWLPRAYSETGYQKLATRS